MNKTIKRVIFIVLAVLLIVAIGIFIYFAIQKMNNKANYEIKIDNATDILANQVIIDEQIKNMSEDEANSFDDPAVLKNPYTISSLTALIIFNTDKDVSYDVYLNNNLLTKMESSKKHIIPIYGLVSGKNNIVKLNGSDNTSKEIPIDISDNNYNIQVDTKNAVYDGNYYFLSSIDDPGYYAINSDGDIVWHLSGFGGQDLEFLSNGHILINNGVSSGLNSFTGFYEIDYLGKVYKTYSLENNYHHEVNELENGNLIVAGEPSDAEILESYVSIIDKDTGQEISSLDLYDVFNKVDSSYAESLKGRDLINNSIDYNENTKELILSLRGLNAVISLNYDTQEINWILGNKKDFSDNFNKYILKSSDGSRLPLGQHSAFINKNGYLGLLNNDYDVTAEDKAYLKSYESNYSSATYYEINKTNMTYKTVWNYIDQDKVFNYALSSFNISNDNHKIINFGWSFEKSAYNTSTSIYDDYHVSYSRLVDLDENNNITFRAKLPSNIYRAFKHKFYESNTNNFEPKEASILNAVKESALEEVSTLSIQDKLNNAEEPICDIDFSNDVIDINFDFTALHDVKIVFKSDAISYIYYYKHINQPVNNRINLNIKGKYDVYIVINDVYYKTDTVLDTNNKTMVIKNNKNNEHEDNEEVELFDVEEDENSNNEEEPFDYGEEEIYDD